MSEDCRWVQTELLVQLPESVTPSERAQDALGVSRKTGYIESGGESLSAVQPPGPPIIHGVRCEKVGYCRNSAVRSIREEPLSQCHIRTEALEGTCDFAKRYFVKTGPRALNHSEASEQDGIAVGGADDLLSVGAVSSSP